jgi:hypothetical protein
MNFLRIASQIRAAGAFASTDGDNLSVALAELASA